MPLLYRSGHMQVDFGETLGVIGGVKYTVYFYVMSYPVETTEAFCDGNFLASVFLVGFPNPFSLTIPRSRWPAF